MPRVRRILLWALLAFIVYAIVKSPGQAADIFKTAWDIIMQGFRGIGGFFDALLSRR